MSDLTNSLINATYKKLIQVSSSGNEGISGTLTNVQTGDGTNTALKLATSAAQVDGTLFVGQTFGVSGDASVAGNLAISNKVCASAYYGDGSNLTGLVFSGDVSVSSLIVGGNVTIGGTLNVAGNTTITGNVMVSGGEIQIKNTGTQSNIKLYCESSNAHYAALQAPPHASFSGNITITLPTSAATLVGTSTTDTLTNKTFGDKVDFNSDVCISGDSVLVGSATIGGTLSVGGAVNMLSTATVSGTAGFLGAVRVSGNTSVGGTLDVAGNVSLGGNVTVKGDVFVSSKVCASAFYGDGTNITGIPITGNISVSNAVVGGTLRVSSTATIEGAAVIKGGVSLGDVLKVAGATTIESAAGFLGTVRVSGATSLESSVIMKSTLTVVGATHLQSTLSVAGNGTFAEKVCASAFFGDGTNITGIPITGNISVADAIVGGTLRVSGATSLEDAVVMKSTVTVIGAAHLQGATSLGSTLKVLGATTITGNTGFLGTVRVSGATSIEGAAVLKSTLTVVGATHLQSTLSVAGNGTFAEKVCASAFFGDGANLTNVPAVITGNISVNNATIGGNLFVGGTATIVGNTTMTANLGVGGTLDVVGNTSIGGTSNITGKAEFESDVSVSGDINVGGHVTIAGAVQLGSTLSVTGYAHFKDDVSVSGNAIIAGTVSVGGGIIDLKNTGSQSELRMYCESGNAHYAALKAPAHSAFSGNIALVMPATADTLAGIAATQTFTNKTFGDKVEFDNDVCISGNAFIGGTATIAGNTSVGGTLTVGGKAEFDSDVCISGNSQLVGTLKVTGATTVTGNTGFLGTVRVSGATSLEGALVVGGKAELNGDVCVSGNSQLVGTLKVTGATTITGATGVLGSMRVSGATSLEGTLKVLGGAAAAVCATAINGVTSVSLNFATAQNFTTTVTAAHTLAKPINCVSGQTGSIFLTQSGGSGTMAYNADFKFIGGTDPTLSTADGAVDRLDYIIVSASANGVGGDIQMIISQAYA